MDHSKDVSDEQDGNDSSHLSLRMPAWEIIRIRICIAMVLWTLVCLFAFLWSHSQFDHTVQKMARAAAQSSFEKDILYRLWNSEHGGVYAPVTDKTTPHPHLSHIPERDLVTPSGRNLTLVHPAYMTRQVHELEYGLYKHRGHITSLNPINPANKPDEWERQAMLSFERGASEITSVEMMDGQPHLRFMRPLKTQESCLKCHAVHGYKLGDLYGGISISVPLHEYEEIVFPYQRDTIIITILVWILGIVVLYAALYQIRRRQREDMRTQAILANTELRFQSIFENSPIAIWEEDFSDAKKCFDELRKSGVTNFREYFNQHIDEVASLAEKVRVLQINQTSVQVFGATTKEQVIQQLPHYFTPKSMDVFQEEMIALAEGQTHFSKEASFVNMEGKPVIFDLTFFVQPEYKETLAHVLVSFVDITERKLVEETLRRERDQTQKYLDTVEAIIVALNAEGNITLINKKGCRLLGYAEEELLGKNWFATCLPQPEGYQKVYSIFLKIIAGEIDTYEYAENPILACNGELRHIAWHNALLRDEQGQIIGALSAGEDITIRKQTEQEKEKLQNQLLQAQKLESIGRLAGGVAHDFNNMLSVILGYTTMTLDGLTKHDPLRSNLEEVILAAERSANLTRQLLAFARKQTITPKVISINQVVDSMLKMLRRLIGENIELLWQPGDSILPVKMDPSQIDQIMANLVVNAHDAIQNTGTITIETQNAEIDESYCKNHAGVLPGQYVMLVVSDTGCGMSKDVVEHIFEPFFTTKTLGQGTGLGLATVYGIVKQNNGLINIYSELGKGSTFKIYLPAYTEKNVVTADTTPAAGIRRGTETILLVEDEQALLQLTKNMLEKLGYVVLPVNRASKAMYVVKEYKGEIHLVITDVVMAVMNGYELYKKVLEIRPKTKCLFMSGYTSNAITQHGMMNPNFQFLQKPFSMKDLAAKIREALES